MAAGQKLADLDSVYLIGPDKHSSELMQISEETNQDLTKLKIDYTYNNENDRQNIFNQTDFTYKFDLGWSRHTLLFGAEFGHQESDNWRHNGTFGPGNGQCASFTTANGSATGQCNVLFSSPTIFSPNVTFPTTQTRNHVDADVRAAAPEVKIAAE